MGCSFYRVRNGFLKAIVRLCSQPVDDTREGFFKTRIGALPRYNISHWESAIKAAVPFRSEQPLNEFENGGRGKVNDWGQKVCESRSQGQREQRRGLLFFHLTLIGMAVYSISPFLSYWSMVCHEMFARRIIHGEDKIPTWSTRSSLIKALQPTQQNKQRVLQEWNEIGIKLHFWGSRTNHHFDPKKHGLL